MKFLLSTSPYAALAFAGDLLLSVDGARLKPNLRQSKRALRGPPSQCIVSAISYLQIPGDVPVPGGEEQLGCDDGSGSFAPLGLSESQAASVADLARDGGITFGVTRIDVSGAAVGPDGSVTLPPGAPITVVPGTGNPFDRRGLEDEDRDGERRLQSGTGNKHFILFRVTDSLGEVHAHDAATMSDNLFGTSGDGINLATQLSACSVGKYTVVPGGKAGYDTTPLEAAPGVIEITIPISLNNLRNTVRNAALDEAERVLGEYFGGSTTAPLTTYMDHALFSLKNCVQECGWAAYAGVGSYYQFYQGGYYAQAGVQLHEHGHNMQLAHSGGLDGQTYTDHTCAMGNPLYGDDLGRMCFNPAKNWQMQFNPHPTTVISGWYADEDFVTVDTNQGARTVKMMGIGEYDLQGDGASVPRKAVALRIANGTTRPQYVAFNSAKGANAQNDEADNLVTVVEYTGTAYDTSSLKGYIGQGGAFTTTEGRIVEALCINTAVTPSLACVCVRASGQTCPADCQCQDVASPTSPPTPTPPPVLTSPPTPPPTPPPTAFSCDQIASGKECKDYPACVWSRGYCILK